MIARVRAEAIRKLVPGWRVFLVMYPGAGHLPMAGCRVQFNQSITDWIQKAGLLETPTLLQPQGFLNGNA